MKHICYIISGIDKALAFEWICEGLDKNRFALHFVLLHYQKGGLENYLSAKNIAHARIHYRGKKDMAKAVLKTYNYLRNNKIELVHCHLLDAGLVGTLASKLAGIHTRIYTRHYSTYHHVYHPKGLWYDRIINALSTHIVAVSEVVKKVLTEREGVRPEKVSVIHHGFPLESFLHPDTQKVTALKRKYNIQGKWPVIGVISRFVEWKGIQYILPAFLELQKKLPNAHLLLANAKGDPSYLMNLLNALDPNSYTTIAFEDDLFSLLHCFDIFVHVPVDNHSEAFGQVYVEALAAGVPSIFTLSGIANEIAVDNKNAVIVPYRNKAAIFDKMMLLIKDEALSAIIKQNGPTSVQETFGLDLMIRKLAALYE